MKEAWTLEVIFAINHKREYFSFINSLFVTSHTKKYVAYSSRFPTVKAFSDKGSFGFMSANMTNGVESLVLSHFSLYSEKLGGRVRCLQSA